jgi:pectinesterase
LVTAACGQQAEEAEARAKAWGFPAVRIVRNLTYAVYGQRQLKLDVYRPPESGQQGAVPGVVVVRGGQWRHGDKRFFGYIAGQLAMDGFVTASIEYRTSDEAKFPAAVQDVKAAVRWMRANAVAYGVNADAIGAIGGSAGAHLVAMLGTSTAVNLEGEGGNSATSSEVQAVVAMAGAYNLQSMDGMGPEFIGAVTDFIGAPLEAHVETMAAASPVTHVSSRSAPLLLLHSRTDPLVPFGQSVEMEQSYRRVGAHVVLKAIEAPGSHAFWADPHYSPEAKRQAVEFLRRHLKVAK